MKRKIVALFGAVAFILSVGLMTSTPANAATKSGCNGAVVHTYYHYKDGGNNWRVRLQYGDFYIGSPDQITGKLTLQSNSGVHWSSGWEGGFGTHMRIYAPSQANSLLSSAPRSIMTRSYPGWCYSEVYVN